MSPERLRGLLNRLSAEEIARLPLDRLPAEIPADWSEELPAEKAQALEQLRERMADPRQANAALVERTAQIRAAIRWLGDPDTLTRWLDTLESRLVRAERLLRQWRERNDGFAGGGRSQQTMDSTDAEIELASPDSIRLADIEQQCAGMSLEIQGQHGQMQKYVRLVRVVDKLHDNGSAEPRLAEVVRVAHRELERVQNVLSRFRLLRLHLGYQEMLAVRREIEDCGRRRLELKAEIDALSRQLKQQSGGWFGRLGGKGKSAAVAETRDRIAQLGLDKQGMRVAIENGSIYEWLNLLVDATLDNYCNSMARTQIDKVRALFVTLVKYRRRTDRGLGDERRYSQALGADPSQELQQVMIDCFEAIHPDALQEATVLPMPFGARLEQLKNQMLHELLAPTAPRHVIQS